MNFIEWDQYYQLETLRSTDTLIVNNMNILENNIDVLKMYTFTTIPLLLFIIIIQFLMNERRYNKLKRRMSKCIV